MPARVARREFAKEFIDTAIRKALDTLGRKPRRAFDHLLWNVQARSELLRPSRHVGRIEAGWLDRIVQGLLALVEHRRGWLRPVEAWEPGGGTSISLFSSLAHHLLADYQVPPVLLSVWFGGTDRSAQQRQHWFCHVGRGGSLRTAGFPVGLTRRMAHLFAHAPADFPVESALRWSQVRGVGGSDDLARAVADSRLGREFDDDEFWASVFLFFVNHPELGPARVGPVVEFLHHERFEQRRVIIGEDTEVSIDAPQPRLSLKGWSAASLLRRVEEWQARRQAEEREARRKAESVRALVRWGRSAIGEFRKPDERGRTWTIRELLDSDELAAEGRAMSHCVATYTSRCARRTSTIWSVGIEGPGGRERAVTVEVHPESREVVQAKARCNERPDEPSLAILRLWARRESLIVAV
jgi:hypothetical protein